MKTCSFCKTQNADSALRCTKCGMPVEMEVFPDLIRPTQMERHGSIGMNAGSDAKVEGNPAEESTIPRGRAARPAKPIAAPLRPMFRPTVAVICLLDDDGKNGERIRVRSEKAVIGRSEGDIQIPHDTGISSSHLEITRQVTEGSWRWFVKDLFTTNGSFMRVDETPIRDGQQIMVGSRRYKFQTASLSQEAAGPSAEGKTQAWQSLKRPKQEDLVPSLVEQRSDGDGSMVSLTKNEHQFGRDKAVADLYVASDPFLDPAHCTFHKDAQGDWFVRDLGSCNGTWIQFEEREIRDSLFVRIGEQNISIRIP